MFLGELIRQYREQNNLSLQDFAKKSSLSIAYINQLERNRNPKTGRAIVPSLETFVKISSAMNMSLDKLFNMVDENQPIAMQPLKNSISESRHNDYPLYNIYPITTKKFPLVGEIACGEPIYANEDRESYVMAGTDIDADFCVKAKGNSMIGARILDGDIVFIKEVDMVNNGEIAAVAIDDEVLLKRLYYSREENILMLHSENPRYAVKRYTGEELNHIRILGKAVAFQSDII